MRISRLHIQNFRCLKDLKVDLGGTTVLIGANNAGKTAIVDAIRIVLSRRWGQRGTGFTENDIHRPNPEDDPRTLPPVTITLMMEEENPGDWNADMVAALNEIITIHPDGKRNILTLRVTCAWNPDKESFDPAWQFLDSAGEPLPERRRAINLTGFFNYMPLFWLGALRDAADEFTPRSGHWGRLLRSVRVPADLEDEVLKVLAELDAKIIAADPRLKEIAEMIGEATRIAIGEGPGSARLNTLPLAIEEMLQRTGIVMRNEDLRPWLPLDHHGQGLQSLAVIFLFQAAVLQQLAEAESPGVEAIFAIEEPEAHLHPQAARTLWGRTQSLSGQKIMTTHSPYFVQHVPLRDLRLVRLREGKTELSSLPSAIVSDLPWNDSLEGFIKGHGKSFYQDATTHRVASRSWFDPEVEAGLIKCYRKDPDSDKRVAEIKAFRHDCRILPSPEDEGELGFHGRRVRGEIFFARRWILVEGVTEYLMMHALGQALSFPLDAHGIAVIDFQQSGSAGVYPGLAEAFGIPWNMITDGDQEAEKIKKQILDRGFSEDDLNGKFTTLPKGHDLEAQLLADGHEKLLREVMCAVGGKSALDCSAEEFYSRIKNKKTGYMGPLSLRIAVDKDLAQKMPKPYVDLIVALGGST